MFQPTLQGRPGRRGSGARLLLIFALLWQALLVQAHVHVDAPLGRTAIAVAGTATIARTAPAATAPCLLCEEQALSGHYVGTGPLLLAPPALPAAWHAATAFLFAAVAARSHAWRSRAPPHSLHA